LRWNLTYLFLVIPQAEALCAVVGPLENHVSCLTRGGSGLEVTTRVTLGPWHWFVSDTLTFRLVMAAV
jgi:hypothetical protein